MSTSRRSFLTPFLVACLASLSLAASACGGSDSAGSSAPVSATGSDDAGSDAPLSPATEDAAAAADAGPAPSFTGLDTYLDSLVTRGVKGFAMQIYDARDKVVYQREFGQCSTPQMCPPGSPAFKVDLATSIASSSKWVTSTTVLAVLDQAVESGKAPNLDAALDAKVAPLLACTGVSGPVTDITMRHLLSFTSGVIPDHPCVSAQSSTLASCACDILRDSAANMVTSPTAGSPKSNAHPPGTTYKYGASHHAVAGAVVEAITGKSYSTVFAERVATPLGLTMKYRSDTNLAGSIGTSVTDYARFVAAVFHDGLGQGPKRVLSVDAVAQQRKAQVPASVTVLMTPQPGLDYGLNTWRQCFEPFDASAIANPDTAKRDPSCKSVFINGHSGKGGYTPFLDVGGRYYAVFAMREVSPGGGADYTADELSVSDSIRMLTHLAMTTGGK